MNDENTVKDYKILIPFSDNYLQIDVEDFFSYCLNNSPIPKIILDQKSNIERSNSVFTSMIGKSSSLNLMDIIHNDDKPELNKLINNVITKSLYATIDARPIEVRLVNDANSTVLLYLNRLTNVDNKSDEIKLVGHLIDTTERKNLEMHFVHSQKMQAVGQLAGGIAHDFNNLLTAMIGFCDLLLMRHPAGDQSFADLMQIKQNANRAANLVRQLLAFSRKQVLQPL